MARFIYFLNEKMILNDMQTNRNLEKVFFFIFFFIFTDESISDVQNRNFLTYNTFKTMLLSTVDEVSLH